jgi:signal recognition particle receptor subunit beta
VSDNLSIAPRRVRVLTFNVELYFKRHLHQILYAFMSLPPSQPSPALLILAHKCDLLTTTTTSGPPDQLAINRVRTVLERELEKRRSQVGGMGIESLGGEGDGSDLGGLECSGSSGGTFRFAEWEGGEIGFLGTSVIMKEAETDEKSPREAGRTIHDLQKFLEGLP